MDEELMEWLYQASLGKVPCNEKAVKHVEDLAQDDPELLMTAAHAFILAEYRQDLANVESNGDTMQATSIKRKIELVEWLMLRAFEA